MNNEKIETERSKEITKEKQKGAKVETELFTLQNIGIALAIFAAGLITAYVLMQICSEENAGGMDAGAVDQI